MTFGLTLGTLAEIAEVAMAVDIYLSGWDPGPVLILRVAKPRLTGGPDRGTAGSVATAFLLATALLLSACGGDPAEAPSAAGDGRAELLPAAVTTVVVPRLVQLDPEERQVTPLRSEETVAQEQARPASKSEQGSTSGYLQGAVLLGLAAVFLLVALALVLSGRRKETK